ncbi:serine/threonine protein kinase SRPK1, partial [Trifolium medium]|nr:serine/threonine protein kinase SRPK1 [Trifolium medium]
LRSHEMELQVDEPDKKTKSVALSSTKAAEDESDEDMALMTRRFQQWAKKNRNFSNSSSGSRSSDPRDKKEEHLRCFNCNKIGHFIA